MRCANNISNFIRSKPGLNVCRDALLTCFVECLASLKGIKYLKGGSFTHPQIHPAFKFPFTRIYYSSPLQNQRSGKWYLQKVNIAFCFMGFSTENMPATAMMNDRRPSEKDALAGSRERRPSNKFVAHRKFFFFFLFNLVHLNV